MSKLGDFCTCTDHMCPLNPVNHDKGCDPCIRKCLKLKEIPSCFFKDISPDKNPKGYTYKDFADFVAEEQK